MLYSTLSVIAAGGGDGFSVCSMRFGIVPDSAMSDFSTDVGFPRTSRGMTNDISAGVLIAVTAGGKEAVSRIPDTSSNASAEKGVEIAFWAKGNAKI